MECREADAGRGERKDRMRSIKRAFAKTEVGINPRTRRETSCERSFVPSVMTRACVVVLLLHVGVGVNAAPIVIDPTQSWTYKTSEGHFMPTNDLAIGVDVVGHLIRDSAGMTGQEGLRSHALQAKASYLF